MSSEYNGQVGLEVPVQLKAIVLSDTTEFTFDKKLSGATIFARGFIPDNDGVMNVVEGGGASIPITCLKGIPVVGLVRRFNIAGTTVGLGGTAQG